MNSEGPVNRAAGRWYNQTVCVIASGPSLTQEDCDIVKTRRWKTIAINDSYRLAPFADVLYACDGSWWKVHYKAVKENYSGELWTQDLDAYKKFGINYVESANKPGLSLKNIIHQGANSGYQAANLAFLWGVNKIIFLGLDCSPSTDGRTHWFGLHGPGLSNSHPFGSWKTHFARMAEDLKQQGVTVINASRTTSLTCFERKTIEEV